MDRYRYWVPTSRSMHAMPFKAKKIEDQVLEDLANAKSEAEKLEILDSYYVYAQRLFRLDEIETYSREAGNLVTRLFSALLSQSLPDITPPYRPAKVQPVE